MIRKVVIRGFKRFEEVTFDITGHVVLAGPNNTGKTTLLQAISAWSMAFEHWKKLNDFNRHNGAYTRAPITRQAFSAVPLRRFDLLWRDRVYNAAHPIEIEITFQGQDPAQNWTLAIEFISQSTEQIYVRPKGALTKDQLRNISLEAVFVPAMTGLTTDEPVYQPEKIRQLLGMARPGEVLRNLLVEASRSDKAWNSLCDSIKRLFDYVLLLPDISGPDILAEYSMTTNGPRFDIASAGSGFQQVLMLLAFLNTRPASVLLIDEPDSHLHILLQEAIYNELRTNAVRQTSQLIIATHSEVVINSVDTDELYMMFTQPRKMARDDERKRLINSLRGLENIDIMMVDQAQGVLYLEDKTDLNNLKAWARVLNHPVANFLETKVYWKKTVVDPAGMDFRTHYGVLKLVRNDLPGLALKDRDGNDQLPSLVPGGDGLTILYWNRYEIESYLMHPEALARYVRHVVGPDAELHVADMMKYFTENYPPAFLKEPLQDIPFLKNTKARTELIPPALNAAGLPNVSHSQYNEIAALMLPEEIHPEVREKLDAIQRAFNL